MSDLEHPESSSLSELLRQYADQIRDPEVPNELIADRLDSIAAVTASTPGVGWCTIALPYAPLFVEFTSEGLRYSCGHSPTHVKSI